MRMMFTVSKTKEDITEEIQYIKANYFEHVNKNAHSPDYYLVLESMFDKMLHEIQKAVLIEPLPENWAYFFTIDYYKAELQVRHFKPFIKVINGIESQRQGVDQTFTLINVPVPMLTAEEFADRNDVKLGTVLQWINRCKIKTAYKTGRTWKISALTDKPRRGYVEGKYKIIEPISIVPESLSDVIAEVFKIRIRRDRKAIDVYHVCLWDRDGKELKRFKCNTVQKEELEGMLIADPGVKYDPGVGRNVQAEIVDAALRAEWEDE